MRCARKTEADATPRYFPPFVEGRRGEILDAALAVFAEKGYETGTMREIAARLGVTEPALYRHYTGKEALLIDLVKTAGDRIVAEAASRLAEVRAESLHDDLGALLRRRRADVVDSRHIMSTLMDAAPHNETVQTAVEEHFGRPMVRNMSEFVPRIDAYFGIERSPEELAARVRAFMSLFIGYFVTGKFFAKPANDDAIADAMLAIMGWQDRPV
jgi:AcrR family transcriptional regulator